MRSITSTAQAKARKKEKRKKKERGAANTRLVPAIGGKSHLTV
jgi:hypothetical protein